MLGLFLPKLVIIAENMVLAGIALSILMGGWVECWSLILQKRKHGLRETKTVV